MFNVSFQLNSDCHTFVRDLCHTYGIKFTLKQLKFIETAYEVHKLSGEYFDHSHYPCIPRNNFSQIIHRINKRHPLIIKQVGGKSPMFSLKGIKIDQNVREKHTGVNESYIDMKIQQLYNLASKQPPFMHDIHLSSKTLHLYDNLLKTGISTNKNNKQFLIPILVNSRFNSKAVVSPNGRIDLHIGCSQLPIPCTRGGFSDLTEHIAEVKYYLSIVTNSQFISEPAYKWIFEYYHFNRDSEPIIDPAYKFSLGQHGNFYYVKDFDNGVTKARIEEKRTPKTTLFEEENRILSEKPVFTKASDLLK